MNSVQIGLAVRAYSAEEKIRIIREFTRDREKRVGLAGYSVAPGEWLCSCRPDGQEAWLEEDVPGGESVVFQIETSEFTAKTIDIGDRILVQITQTKFGRFVEEDDETILEEVFDSEVCVFKGMDFDPKARLDFYAGVELREVDEGLDSLDDEGLDAIFRNVIEERPDLLD